MLLSVKSRSCGQPKFIDNSRFESLILTDNILPKRMHTTLYIGCFFLVYLAFGTVNGSHSHLYRNIPDDILDKLHGTIQSTLELERRLKHLGLIAKPKTSVASHRRLFRSGDLYNLQSARERGTYGLATSQLIYNRHRESPDTLPDKCETNKTKHSELCEYDENFHIHCEADSMYRTYDGSCNNLGHPAWGKSFTPHQRLLRAYYDDCHSSPRQTSVDGQLLLSARKLSTIWALDEDRPSHDISILFMQWGQFIDHDITSTGIYQMHDDSDILCCPEEIKKNAKLRHPECFPIEIPEDDPFYKKFHQTCMEFVRSMPAPPENCVLDQRQQLNLNTPVIDGSMIYGSTMSQAINLRSFTKGKLRSSPDNFHLLPPYPYPECKSQDEDQPCFLAGDIRVDENIGLSLLHQSFFREHNRIAEILGSMNRHWDDEKIYQETRRIIVAILQHSTYNEFLPIALGKKTMQEKKLASRDSGYEDGYDKEINPNLSSIFASAAYRFGHTMIQKFVEFANSTFDVTHKYFFSSLQSNPMPLYSATECTRLTRGLTITPSQQRNHYFTKEVTQYLFQSLDLQYGLDLVALNIQRGRDHGTPPYVVWTRYCGNNEIKDFDTLPAGLPRDLIREMYSHVEDIDAYVGFLDEAPEDDALLGPTLVCLLAEQFYRTKFGDRFWYENGDRRSSFTLEQLQEIRKITISKILCDSTGIGKIQPKAMFLPSESNKRQSCKSIPGINLEMWREVNTEWLE